MTAVAIAGRRAPPPDDACWAAVQELCRPGQKFGYSEVMTWLNVSQRRSERLVRSWCVAGLVRLVDRATRGERALYEMVAGVPQPVQGRTPEQNLWTALRIGGSLSPVDLAGLADTDSVRVTVEDARAYCQLLTRAGYLRVMRKANPARGIEAVYRLILNTGPEAPRARRVPAIHDPNKGTVTPIGGAA